MIENIYSTPAMTLSTKIRPQSSQTITFFRAAISICLWGGTVLNQPPQASLSTGTTARPLLTLPLKRLYALSNRSSITFSARADSLPNYSSSFWVSAMIFSNSELETSFVLSYLLINWSIRFLFISNPQVLNFFDYSKCNKQKYYNY